MFSDRYSMVSGRERDDDVIPIIIKVTGGYNGWFYIPQIVKHTTWCDKAFSCFFDFLFFLIFFYKYILLFLTLKIFFFVRKLSCIIFSYKICLCYFFCSDYPYVIFLFRVFMYYSSFRFFPIYFFRSDYHYLIFLVGLSHFIFPFKLSTC